MKTTRKKPGPPPKRVTVYVDIRKYVEKIRAPRFPKSRKSGRQ